ncbi:MAG: DMT family transporter [Geminicoccaceae bacterium]|nr:MAG: DMT family transporter [Geminicoccaceae bacterium]
MSTSPGPEIELNRDAGLAIGFKLIAVGLFSCMSAMVKALAGEIPLGQVVFARSFFALLPILWLIWRAGGFHALKTTRPMGHALRAAAGLISMFAGFAALGLAPLADVVAIGFAATVFTPALAFFILKERVGIYRWSAVGIGFVGVLLMLQPAGLQLMTVGLDRAPTETVGLTLALVAAVFVALATVAVRSLATKEQPAAIIFYFTMTCVVASALTLPFDRVMPDARQAWMLIGIGLLGGVAQIFMTRAYVLAPASLVAPFDYTAMVYAAIIGYVVFAERMEPIMMAGAGLVIGAGLFIFYREQRLGLPRGRARRRGVGPPGPPGAA